MYHIKKGPPAPNGAQNYTVTTLYDVRIENNEISCTCMQGTIDTGRKKNATCRHAKAVQEYREHEEKEPECELCGCEADAEEITHCWKEHRTEYEGHKCTKINPEEEQ